MNVRIQEINIDMPGVVISFRVVPICVVVTDGFGVIDTLVLVCVEFFGGLPLGRTIGVIEDDPSKMKYKIPFDKHF